MHQLHQDVAAVEQRTSGSSGGTGGRGEEDGVRGAEQMAGARLQFKLTAPAPSRRTFEGARHRVF